MLIVYELGRKLGVSPLLGKELSLHQTQSSWAEVYLHTKWYLNPSSHLATTDMGRKLGLCPFRGG